MVIIERVARQHDVRATESNIHVRVGNRPPHRDGGGGVMTIPMSELGWRCPPAATAHINRGVLGQAARDCRSAKPMN